VFSIEITQPGPPGDGGSAQMDTIAGVARGPDITRYKVVIYAGTDYWYVQPFVDAPFTAINDDGTWEADIHPGSRYVALLVKPSYRPPAKLLALPKVGGDILAIHRAIAKK
jgi:hypothetical protein